jgi:hypothetical protein
MRQRLHFAYPLSFAVLPALFFVQSAPGVFTPAEVLLAPSARPRCSCHSRIDLTPAERASASARRRLAPAQQKE